MNLLQLITNLNWLDWALIVIVIIFLIDGLQIGFLALASGFIAYLAAFWVSIHLHAPVGAFLISILKIDPKWKDIAGYIAVIFLVQILVSQLLIYLIRRLVRRIWPYKVDAVLGAILSVINTLISLTLILLLLVALPIPASFKNPIEDSVISKRLFTAADTYVKPLKDTVEEAVRQATKFMTIHPSSTERLLLDIQPQAWDLAEDEISERHMLELVNNERIKRGIVSLSSDTLLTTIARKHSRDMLTRRYFAHISPEGDTLKERLDEYSVTYQIAAENLAYAPAVDVAHEGLMNSESHRKNILDPSLDKIGIGIIDAGIYGKMFTQVFTSGPNLFKNYP